jgi:3-dehydroquinate synthase
MRIIDVRLGERSYRAYVSQDLIERLGELVRENLQGLGRCAVITSEPLKKLFGGRVAESLEGAGLSFNFILAPDGEGAKTWEEAGRMLGQLVDLGIDRKSAIIALGGGAIGDLSAFVSSIYMRGVRHVQVPTTLLSQVDSCLGGKAAVNHPKGKNLIGSFHQPSLCVVDPGLLITLPDEEFISGLAEVIKYGVIADAELFETLESSLQGILDRRMPLLTELIARCLSIKARFVEADEMDVKGYRAALNYGHTVGHAVEHLTGMRHGEAVALGMIVEAGVSRRLGLFPGEDEERLSRLLEAAGLKKMPPKLDPSRVVEAMRRDKKAEAKSPRLALPTGIGRHPRLLEPPLEVIYPHLEAVFNA